MVTIFEKLDRGRSPPTREVQKPTSAQKLLDWLQKHWTESTISARDICAYGPKSIRDKKTAVIAAEVLVEFGWLIPLKTHRYDRREWQIVRKPIIQPTVAAIAPDLGP